MLGKQCWEIMKKKTLRFGKGFKVVMGNRRVQAAQMVIAPGDSEGGPENPHRGADQWLLVISGTGTATVGGRTFALKRHSLLLIEHGERHEIKNTGSTKFETINFYSPPGYTKTGDELPAGKS
jgi:mannose-6-phosphate isomerase-like protein (cupin superfamily)